MKEYSSKTAEQKRTLKIEGRMAYLYIDDVFIQRFDILSIFDLIIEAFSEMPYNSNDHSGANRRIAAAKLIRLSYSLFIELESTKGETE